MPLSFYPTMYIYFHKVFGDEEEDTLLLKFLSKIALVNSEHQVEKQF